MEGQPTEEILKYIKFYRKLGLPTTLKEMYLEDVAYEDLLKVGQAATQEGETMTNQSAEISAEDVADAIIAVDQISQLIP